MKSVSTRCAAIAPSPTLEIDAKAVAMREAGINVIGFGAGQPDFDTPQHIKDAAIKAINDGKTKYTPASGILDLKKAVVEKFQRDNGLSYEPSQIVVSNGAKHSLFQRLCRCAERGRRGHRARSLLGELPRTHQDQRRRAGVCTRPGRAGV